ncbi:class I SAM-dependent methyltransferase [Spiroplasma clarkii]|uniref:class I SAM-dependent methyltransferase n=1 Tax=Spiroplasma clarkii TaxID=2139 RepID=UPI0011BAD43A|nr:class I SAM-dependent methyltransferase [Spiroplasma clarkii]
MKKDIKLFLQKYNLNNLTSLKDTILKYGSKLDPTLVYIAAEMLNPNKKTTAAFYTDKIICEEIFKVLPKIEKDHIKVLEPSVGAGAFLPFIAEHFKFKQKLEIWIIDIDENELNIAELIFETYYRSKYPNVEIKYINDDYLKFSVENENLDLVIGNPPYYKVKMGDKNSTIYKKIVNYQKHQIYMHTFLKKH